LCGACLAGGGGLLVLANPAGQACGSAVAVSVTGAAPGSGIMARQCDADVVRCPACGQGWPGRRCEGALLRAGRPAPGLGTAGAWA
jgi:hypothetical protein